PVEEEARRLGTGHGAGRGHCLRQGMTLMELLISFGVLAVMLVSLVVVFGTLLNASSKASNTAAGTFFAEEILEQTLSNNLYWPPFTGSGGIYTVDDRTRTRFFYQVDTTPVSGVAGQFPGGYYVEVKVWWWTDAPNQSRRGHGRLTTQVGRFHYPGAEVVVP
ncbi:MAG: type II secretion system protein, partial [Candidatus Eremiobacterota bacterium]